MPGNVLYSDSEIVTALKVNGGQVYATAEALGCDPGTIYDRMSKSPTVKAAKVAADEHLIDLAETAIKKRIEAGDIAAIIYTLKTKGKERGWMERNELTIKLDNLDPELLALLAKHNLTIESALANVVAALRALPDPSQAEPIVAQPTAQVDPPTLLLPATTESGDS